MYRNLAAKLNAFSYTTHFLYIVISNGLNSFYSFKKKKSGLNAFINFNSLHFEPLISFGLYNSSQTFHVSRSEYLHK